MSGKELAEILSKCPRDDELFWNIPGFEKFKKGDVDGLMLYVKDILCEKMVINNPKGLMPDE